MHGRDHKTRNRRKKTTEYGKLTGGRVTSPFGFSFGKEIKMKFREMWNKMSTFGRRNDSAILVGLSIVGLLATGYAAYKAGIKADKILEEKKKDLSLVDPEDKEAKKAVQKEIVKEVAPVLAPPIIMGAATVACILGSHKASQRKIAALSAAYTIAETSVKELNGKMRETLGEQKTRQIRDAVAKDKFEQGEQSKEVLTAPLRPAGIGDVLCKDLYSGRTFWSNAQKIQQAINHISADIVQDMYVSLNDFYSLIGIPSVPMGEDLGWNVDDLYRGQLPITFTALLTEEQIPCLCVDFDISVRRDFRDLH